MDINTPVDKMCKLEHHVAMMLSLYRSSKRAAADRNDPEWFQNEYRQAIHDCLTSLKKAGLLKSYSLHDYSFEIVKEDT